MAENEHSTKCRFWSSKLRGLVRLQLISENYSRRLSIFLSFHTARVISAVLTASQPLPVFPNQRTSSDRAGRSGSCQRTKSLRSSPLRGGKNREAGSQLRGQRWRV